MRLVAIGGDGDVLHRHRHLRRGDVAQFEIRGEEAAVAGGKADAQARQARALRQRMEDDDVGEIRRPPLRSMPGGGVVAVDFAIAFVGEHQEAEAARQRDQPGEIGAVGHRALRVRGRGEIERDRARQELSVSASRSGRKPVARVAGR